MHDMDLSGFRGHFKISFQQVNSLEFTDQHPAENNSNIRRITSIVRFQMYFVHKLIFQFIIVIVDKVGVCPALYGTTRTSPLCPARQTVVNVSFNQTCAELI